MFTGISEEIGTVKSIEKFSNSAKIEIVCQKVLQDTKLGDSISIDGVCQTVVELSSNSFLADVSAETLNVTNFQNLKKGDIVNLERALTLASRLGGHIVSGHVDGLAKVVNIEKLSQFCNLTFEVDENLSSYIAKKGSVTINGVSLTVAEISNNKFKIAVIPHTLEQTTLKNLKSGDFVNLETDILAKYVEKFLSRGNNKVIDENFLKENGFF